MNYMAIFGSFRYSLLPLLFIALIDSGDEEFLYY